MASIAKRRRKDGSVRWDVTVRHRGFATVCKSFPNKIAAEVWASKVEARIVGSEVVVTSGTLGELRELARPFLKCPHSAALAYGESELGAIPLRRVTPQLLNPHKERLISAPGASPLYRRKNNSPTLGDR